VPGLRNTPREILQGYLAAIKVDLSRKVGRASLKRASAMSPTLVGDASTAIVAQGGVVSKIPR
jgi:hypothetical protein